LASVAVRIYTPQEHLEDPEPPYILSVGADAPVQDEDLSRVVARAVLDIQDHAFRQVRTFVALHAGAVAGSDGAVILPAKPDVGKSSLVAALIRRGFGYLSDEAAAIDPITSRVYPFPRWIQLDVNTVDLFPGLQERLEDRKGLRGHPFYRFVRPQDLGAIAAELPKPITAIVFPGEDREGAPRLSRIGKAEAMERMAANCFNMFRYGERGVVVLARVANEAEAYSLEGGTAEARAALLLERFGPANDAG
jgi:hypothetical protein